MTLPPSASAASGQSTQHFNFDSSEISGWASEFAFIPSTTGGGTEIANNKPLLVYFKNGICKNYDGDNQIQGESISIANFKGDVFALRARPLWACGGQGKLFSKGNQALASGFQVVSSDKIMPTLDFANSGYLGTKGFLHLSTSHPSERLACVKNDVENADHFNLEVLRPNLFLSPAEQNGTQPSNQQLQEIVGKGKTGSLLLQRSDFKNPGLYQVRLWSADKQNKHVGVAGDHIIVNVEE